MNNVFDFSIVTNWIHQMLTSLMPEGLAIFLECVVIGVCIILMYAVLAIILIYMERKIARRQRQMCIRDSLLPMPPRSDARGEMGIAPSALRRHQDVDKGNH